MGRLIKGDRQIRLVDIDKARKEYSNLTDLTMNDTTLLLTLFGVLDNAPTVEAIPKADYENRLKADLIAILTELQLEIEEKDADLRYCGHNLMAVDCIDIIQQKINSLKEKSNEL